MRALVPLALAASLCLPCSAWDDEDSLGNPNSTRRNQTAGFGQKAANNSFGYQQRTPAGLESAAESNSRRERKHREFTERTRRMNEEQDRQWAKLRDRRETENNAHEARQWRNVETVAGAFVATGPYYKSGNKMVITDKGLVYAVGNDGVVAPDGYYYRSGNFWVGPDNKGGSVSGSGNNEFIAGGSQGSAIGVDRGFFTERGYSWPAYPKSSFEKPSWCSR